MTKLSFSFLLITYVTWLSHLIVNCLRQPFNLNFKYPSHFLPRPTQAIINSPNCLPETDNRSSWAPVCLAASLFPKPLLSPHLLPPPKWSLYKAISANTLFPSPSPAFFKPRIHLLLLPTLFSATPTAYTTMISSRLCLSTTTCRPIRSISFFLPPSSTSDWPPPIWPPWPSKPPSPSRIRPPTMPPSVVKRVVFLPSLISLVPMTNTNTNTNTPPPLTSRRKPPALLRPPPPSENCKDWHPEGQNWRFAPLNSDWAPSMKAPFCSRDYFSPLVSIVWVMSLPLPGSDIFQSVNFIYPLRVNKRELGFSTFRWLHVHVESCGKSGLSYPSSEIMIHLIPTSN